MKFLKGTDFVAWTSTPQDTRDLLSELEECLNLAIKNADAASQASKWATACDGILRACIHRFAEDLACPDHLQCLRALAERAYHGYVEARPQYVPLYLERLLYHLLRGAASRGPSETKLGFANLLYAELLKHQPPEVPADDFTAIAKSAFSVLWKSADVVAKTGRTPAQLRAVLSSQLQAVRFLVLLEHDSPVLLLREPPFFTSPVAQHAAAAASIFEAQRSPLPREEACFLSEQLFSHLVTGLLERTGTSETLPFLDTLCIFEVTVMRARYLCKSGCFAESKEVLQQSQGCLRSPKKKRHFFGAGLDILSAGVKLNQMLVLHDGSVGPLFAQTAQVLRALLDSDERLLKATIESCQLFIMPLYGYTKESKRSFFSLHDVLGISAFMERYFELLGKLLNVAPPDSGKQQQALKKLLYYFAQLYTTLVYDSLQTVQAPESSEEMLQLVATLQKVASWMLDMLAGLPQSEQAEYLDVSAYCVSRLGYSFYCQKMYVESNSVVELFCKRLIKEELFKNPEFPTEKLHNCFRLLVENYRKLGLLEDALQAVVMWLVTQHNKIIEQMAEPVSFWLKVKMDASKSGADDLRLKTLKEGLEGCNLTPEVLLKVLLEELKAYKSVRTDISQERFNVICDLLDICAEGSSFVHERAVILIELAQVLCYHDYTEQTECSALDSIHEALRLLDLVPKTPQNEEQLQDDKAQALLWLYICTIENKMHESNKEEQRTKNSHAQGQKGSQLLESVETNDLGYEDRSQDDKFLYLGITFNLSADSVKSKCLDDAYVLWKQLLSKGRAPAVRSVEQTMASLHIMAALYRMMGKPLRAIESYFLVSELSSALADALGMTNALCQIAKLFFQLECSSYAEMILKEAESCLRSVDQSKDGALLTKQTLAVLRSRLCVANCKIEEGLKLLLETLQNPTLQRPSKLWYMLRASALELTALYLGLPPSFLPLALRQKLYTQGWKTPETALSDAHKLYRSIISNFLLIGSEKCAKDVPDHLFVDHGDNLVQKWQVLADLFVCSETFVSLLGKIEIVSEAKAFCLEALKISMKLQSLRWCARFLVLKSELELERGELQLCRCDLEQVLFLLESGTVFEMKEEKGDMKIKPKKGRPKGKKQQGLCTMPSEEEQSFLREASLEFVDTVTMQKGNSLTDSPMLKSKLKKHPSFLTHPDGCRCLLCSDVVLLSVCLRWLLASAERELAFGHKGEGLHLLETCLKRCASATSYICDLVASMSQSSSRKAVDQSLSTVGLLDDLVARIYVSLAKQNMSTDRPQKKTWKLLESGLALLSSKRPRLPGLEYQKASLLLTKAVTTVSVLASIHEGDTANIFSGAWAWKYPSSLCENKENMPTAAEKMLKALLSEALNSNTTKGHPEAVQKAKPKRIQETKPLPAIHASDPLAVVDASTEAAPLISRPPVEPCTPAQKSFPVARSSRSAAAKQALSSKTSFKIFEESSSPRLKMKLSKAPKVSRRTKSRLKVVFSDDSDLEGPPEAMQEAKLPTAKEPAASTPRTGRKAALSKKQSTISLARMEECGTNSSNDRPHTSKSQPRRGRPGSRRTARQEKLREEINKAPCEEETLDEPRDEEKEVLRTIEEGFRAGCEVLQGSGRKKQPVPEPEQDQEAVWHNASADLRETFQGSEKRSPTDPLDLHILASSLEVADNSFSVNSIYEILQAAFCSISHNPPGALYSHLCQLMALCLGSRDPVATAYLVSESVAVTLRHQIMNTIHKRLDKMKKSSVASASRQLEMLSLQAGSADPLLRSLKELQDLFAFSCPSPTKLETEGFRKQLQQIPTGITVCVLTLVSIKPGTTGDILLLTRLEKDAVPVTVQIQTVHCKVSLSMVLSEFDAILQEQKVVSNLTEKEDWWLGRTALDKRMKVLIESLERLLGCWRGALLPGCEGQGLAQEASSLQKQLRECGCEVDLALLKVMLTSSHLLAPEDIQRLALGLSPAVPERAQNLLQEAVDKVGPRTCQASSGHLVLILDKHLQKLPWENVPCLKSRTVTRLPSLRFLLSYLLTKKYREESVFNQGINAGRAFYVLNPQRNLSGTEKMFRDWFQSEPGWTGVVGEAPATDQVPSALEERDLYIYAGHGAGARFIDSILKMDCRAVALLFGCSSAALALQGNLEGTGIILKFILAGCPLALGNLWDVTDRDIDRYMAALLKNWLKAGSGAPLLQYVIQSRQAPKLKYMIGAAPVAYGLPVSLQ
ncbi:separin [Sphaerodactylus townsendi]|uniref:separin n=1 Tax=Sphaerodactylus townsendi TaxID=933632 RepID=UPI002025EBDF|nr:separin [Sphaerodactylus townsendi]